MPSGWRGAGYPTPLRRPSRSRPAEVQWNRSGRYQRCRRLETGHIRSIAQPVSVKRWVTWLVASFVESYTELRVMTSLSARIQVPAGYTRNWSEVGSWVIGVSEPTPVAAQVAKASCQSYTY